VPDAADKAQALTVEPGRSGRDSRAPMMPSAPARRLPDPYRLLFPLGIAYALIGAGLWPVHAWLGVAYPGALHRLIMIEGFELSFVLGFLLTAMPGLTKGPACHPVELAIAMALSVAFGSAALAGATGLAHGFFAAAIAFLLVVLSRRLRPAPQPRALELVFVWFGLLCGLTGGIRQAVVPGIDPFGSRLVSLGLVLSLVLGVGSLLVPAFIGLPDPLAIPGIARAHERRGRGAFYAVLLAALIGAFVAEALGRPALGATLRAATATVVVALVWKTFRVPARRDAAAFALWSSGWFVVAGLWLAALFPAAMLAGLHLVFIGGFGLITLGIGTRVVVAHGGYPVTDERRVLSPLVVTLVLGALALRLAAQWVPARSTALLGWSGTAWVGAWLAWLRGSGPRLFGRPRAAQSVVAAPGRR